MTNITEKNTKAEIIQGALEHIDYIETHSFSHRETFTIAAIALLVGFIAG